jgi:hypothetical protein
VHRPFLGAAGVGSATWDVAAGIGYNANTPETEERPVNAVRIETTILTDGELHLTRLPCRQGDRVEAVVLILEDGQARKDNGAQAPSPPTPASQPSSLEDLFRELAQQWRQERGPVSSTTQLAMYPSYQRIIGLGAAVVPLLLRELERQPDHWFWALKAITGADPVPAASRGKLREVAEAWLAWGREQGYSW